MSSHIAYKFRLNPSRSQEAALFRDQRNVCYIKNRMLGDREQTYHNQFVLGDYCSLYNRQTYTVTALRCDLKTKAIGNGLHCSVNRNVSLGEPWKTGDPNKARPRNPKTVSKRASKKPPKSSSQSSADSPSVRRSAYDMQSSALPEVKALKPELKATSATALQTACLQVDAAYTNFFSKGTGHPRYKRPREVGIHYPTKECKVDAHQRKVYLPKIGWVRFYNSRPFAAGMQFSKFAVTREQDHWYISFLVQDDSTPEVTPLRPDQVETIVGGDKGIKKLLAVSGKTQFPNPQFLKAEARRLAIRQRRMTRKQKGSKNRAKAGERVAKLHRTIRRRREDYHWKVAHQFTELADAVAIEELNVSNMMKRCRPKQDESGKHLKNGQSAKSQLNKAIADAAWHDLDQKIKHQAAKKGKLCIPVEPKHTSQECPTCHHIDASNRDGEKFVCSNCGYADDADNNAGTNIAQKAICTAQLNKQKVRVVSSEYTPQICLRRHHQQRLVSRGRRTSQQNKLRHAERTALNSWIQKYVVRTDSKTLALARS